MPPEISRAAAAAQRRISASAARRRTVSEVLLLTSKGFPSQQYQELLNFIKGMQLPPDVSSLFTTVRNDQVANKKALLNSHSQEMVDQVLVTYGNKFALLSHATDELGLGGQQRRSAPRKRGVNDASHAGGAANPGSSVASKAAHPASSKRAVKSQGLRYKEGSGLTLSLDALPAPAFVCDGNGVVIEWNHALTELTGWSASTAVGQPFTQLAVADEQTPGAEQALLGNESEITLKLVTSDGERLDVAFTLSNYKDVGLGTKADEALLAVGFNVTPFVTVAASASQEVHDLMRLIDCANAPIFGINAASLVTEWNRKATHITGRSKWEVVGRRLEDFIRAEDRDSVVEVLQNALEGKETANFEFPLYTKKGERVEILLNAATRRDADGQIVGVVGVGQDITELNAGKAELARVANDLKMLIESANAPILGMDIKGSLTEWNKKAVSITGYTADEMLGRNLVEAEVIKDEFKASVRQVLQNALRGIETDNFELPLYSRGGQRVELLLNATTRHSARGEVVGVVMVGQDITEKKDIEKAQIAAAKARAASDAKGKFMASMSHEMRTPLNGVLGMLQLALDGENDVSSKTLQYVQNAMMSAQHLMNLVNDILDISKIEAGKLELEQKVFNLREVVLAAVEIVKVNALNKNVRIEADLAAELPEFVVGDQQRLRQVLLNLLFNAVKFTPQGSITVRARVQQQFANHLRLHFAVEDTGIGIREENMQALFGLFSKIRDKRVDNSIGVGLGLAICKQLVEMMRGQIHVESEYGKGTKFFFTMLAGRAATAEVEEFQREVAEQRMTTAFATGGKVLGKILVVEDNEFNIEVVRAMLENAGHTVEMAMDGLEGVEMWQAAHSSKEPYDLILMDCNMPVMDGYEATRRIRKLLAEQRAQGHFPIVALTAYAMPGDKEKCLAAGMTDFITKPIQRDGLLSTVQKNIKMKRDHADQLLAEKGRSKTATRKRICESSKRHSTKAAWVSPFPDVDELTDNEEPLNREAARDNYHGPGGDELLSLMEDEFVAKSGALVGRMTVAAAQDNIAELSHELGTLQDFSHILRARGLTAALGDLERVIEEKWHEDGSSHPDAKAFLQEQLKGSLQSVDAAAQRVRSYIISSAEDAIEDGDGVQDGSHAGTPRRRTLYRLSRSANASPRQQDGTHDGATPRAAPSAAAATPKSYSRFSKERHADRSSRQQLDRLHLKAVAGPISGFVQRGEMMIERMQALREQRNSKAFRREALKLRDAVAHLDNKRLAALTQTLVDAPDDAVQPIMQQLQQRLNHVMNYSVRGVLVHNTLSELAEDLRIAASSEDKHTVLMQLSKAASEFQQLSDYISIGNNSQEDAASAEAGSEELNLEELQCKILVAGCVSNGKEMLDAMTREQAHGTLDHAVACRLIADTFLNVVADLGQAAESDEMQAVGPRVDRVNSLFFHVTDLVARNKMVASTAELAAIPVAAPSASEAASDLPQPVVDQEMAIQQFGGDTKFFRRMAVKFIASSRGLVERLVAMVDSDELDIRYVDLRRDAHSLKGAASTIGALQLSQAALDLQLAIEAESSLQQLQELARVIQHQFELVERDLSPLRAEDEEEQKEGQAGKTVHRKHTAAKADRMNSAGKDPERTTIKGHLAGVRRWTGSSARTGSCNTGTQAKRRIDV